MTYDDRDRVIEWLKTAEAKNVTPLLRGILRDIAEHANSKTGESWPGRAELSDRWGVTHRSTRRAIARLHELGLITTASTGRGQRRTRYLLAGQVGGPQRPPTSTSRGTAGVGKGDAGDQVGGPQRPPYPESSRSDSERDDDSGRPSADAPGSPSSDETAQAVAEAVDKLGMSPADAGGWVAEKLAGRSVRSVPSYIRECIRTYSPEKAKQHIRPDKPPASGRGKKARKKGQHRIPPDNERCQGVIAAGGRCTRRGRFDGYCHTHDNRIDTCKECGKTARVQDMWADRCRSCREREWREEQAKAKAEQIARTQSEFKEREANRLAEKAEREAREAKAKAEREAEARADWEAECEAAAAEWEEWEAKLKAEREAAAHTEVTPEVPSTSARAEEIR